MRMRRRLPSLLALFAIALLPTAQAVAAEPVGSASLAVSPGKWRTLDKRGIELAGGGGADSEGRRTRLQVNGGEIADNRAQISIGGALKFAAGEGKQHRVARLSGLRVELGPKSTLSAKLGKRRLVLFDLKPKSGPPAIDGAKKSAQLRGARLVWRGAAAKAIGKRLDANLPKGAFGNFTVLAATVLIGPPPQSGPISAAELPPLARPATAVNISAATVTWWVRSSWINYVASGAGTTAIEGAVPGAPIAESGHPCLDDAGGETKPRIYDYTFPFVNGWYDPPTGVTAIYGSGGVHFSFPGHGIDLSTRNPEIELNGAASRAIFRLRGSGATAYPDARAVMLDLNRNAAPVEGPPGTFAYAAPIRGSLTPDGLSVFGGFYQPPNNHGFGCFAVSFTVPGT